MVLAMTAETRTLIPVSDGNGIRVIRAFNDGEPREHREQSERGIKFFFPKAHFSSPFASHREITAAYLRDERKAWRPEETLEATDVLFTHGRVNIVGAPQAGKGTILFGISEVFEALGKPYVFIDSHYQDTAAQNVVAAIRRAEEVDAAIFVDSADYLFAGENPGLEYLKPTVKLRDIPLLLQRGGLIKRNGERVEVEGRTKLILEGLDAVTVPVALTTHDETWARLFNDLKFREQFLHHLDRYPIYEIPLNLQSKASMRRFLLEHNVPENLAEFLLTMESNSFVYGALTHLLNDKEKVAFIFEAIKNFPVLKALVRPRGEGEVEKKKQYDGRREEFLPKLFAVAAYAASPYVLKDPETAKDFLNDVRSMARIILELEHARVHLAFLRKMK